MSIEIFLGLGSNISPHENIKAALDMLRAEFGNIQISPIYESKAVGFDGDNFLNLVVTTQTDASLPQLIETIHAIEDKLGRERLGPKFSARTIDIDILLYGDLVCDSPIRLPRPEILENAHVLKPLTDLAPNLHHPEDGVTYREHWQRYPKDKQVIWPVSLDG